MVFAGTFFLQTELGRTTLVFLGVAFALVVTTVRALASTSGRTAFP